MTQADFTIANQTFPNTRTELNTSLQALATNSAGNSAPSTPFPNQWWFDSDGNQLYIRNKDNDAWVKVFTIGATSDKIEELATDSLTLAGTTPTLTIGDGGAEDTKIVFDGNAQDFYVALDDSADDLVIGLGNTVGTTPIMSFDESKNVTIHDGTLTVESDNANAAMAPLLKLDRISSSPADGDLIGAIRYTGRLDNGSTAEFAGLEAKIIESSSADGEITLNIAKGGNVRSAIKANNTEVIINDASEDIDFRVESNGNDYMMFVDGGNNRVGFGTSAPTQHTEIVLNSTGSVPTDSEIGSSNAGVAMGLGIHNESNSATYTGIALETRTSQASRWLIANEWQSGYNGDLVFRGRNGASTSSERLRILSNGSLLIGTTNQSPAETNNVTGTRIGSNGGSQFSCSGNVMEVNRDNSEGTAIGLRQAGATRGSIGVHGSTASFNTSSDYRLKENVSYDWNATTKLKQLKPAQFNWISDETNSLVDGFIAHEAQTVVPYSVIGEKDAMESVYYNELDEETQGDTPTKNVGDFKEDN